MKSLDDIDFSSYFPIKEYYEKVVMPIDKKFRVVKNDKFICCLHKDRDPSLGIIRNKKGEVYHCFGCNSWGNVVTLHKKVSQKYFGKTIDDNLALRELCKIFGVDYKELPLEEDYSVQKGSYDKEVQKELAMQQALNRFDISDFRRGFIEGKLENKSIAYFNTLLVNMIEAERER